MKKLIISFLCLLFCNPVFAWVFSSEAVKKDTHAILLPRLLSGKPLEVCIHVRHNRAGRDCKDSACSDVYQSTKVLFEKAYNEWFLQLRRAIQQSNRSAEFKDILDMIPGQFSFVYLNGPQDNYKACTYQEMGYDAFTKTRLILYPVTALTEIGGHTTGGIYEHTDTNPPLLKFHYNYDDFGVPGYPLVNGTGPEKPRYGYSNRSSWSIILHELGHSLGLGDLYAKAAGNSYNSRSFTTSHIQPASAASSIMNESLDVDCDDFDGIINLMDHYYGAGKLKDSKRRTKGWVSLCANRNIAYAYGMPFEITPEEKAHFQAYVARNYVPEVGQADTLAAFSSKVKNVYQKILRIC